MSSADPRQSFKQANAQLRAGDAVGAVETCRSGLAGAPTDVDLLTLLGVALLKTKQPRDALPHLEQATALAPRFVPALENLGKAMLTLGRFEDAIDAYSLALEIQETAEVWDNMGLAYQELGDKKKAEQCYKEAKKLRGGS